MLIDFTEQPGPMSQPNLPAIAPPPPAVKPPTVASMIDGHMKWLVTEVGDLNQDVGMLDTKLSVALTQARLLAIVAIGIAGLSFVALIAVLVMLGMLLGQGR